MIFVSSENSFFGESESPIVERTLSVARESSSERNASVIGRCSFLLAFNNNSLFDDTATPIGTMDKKHGE